MKKVITLIIVVAMCLQANNLKAQATHFNEQWIMGDFGLFQLNFKPNLTPDSFKNNNLDNFYFRGHSNICDSNGRLLLMCNGFTLYDSNGNVVQGGAQLVSPSYFATNSNSSTISQSNIMLPMDSGLYFLIVINVTDARMATWNTPFGLPSFDELLLYKIDIDGNAGLPKVIDTLKLTQNDSLASTMMMACKHSNGQDWWLVKQTKNHKGIQDPLHLPFPAAKNQLLKLFISRDSISPPSYQDFPGSYISNASANGQAMFNCDGTRFALTAHRLNKIFIADFDRSNGNFSNPKFVDVPFYNRQSPFNPNLRDSTTFGLCFSPNSQFIYVSKETSIAQYDLLETDTAKQWYYVSGIDTIWSELQFYHNIYPGPDDKLYIGNKGGLARDLSYINAPSRKGAACDFRKKGLVFLTTPFGGASGPPCQPNYDMDLVPCDTSVDHGEPDGVNDYFAQKLQLKVYPNPASSYIRIDIQDQYKDYHYELISLDGRKLMSGPLTQQIDMPNVQTGLYLLRISSNEGSITKRIVRE